MRKVAVALAVIAPALVLAGCGSKEAPSGQVVATVDGVEITQSELNAELGGRRAPTAQQQKQLQGAVLNDLIARVLLADAAKEQGLDDTPDAAIAKRRAEQAVLISLLQKKLGEATPTVSPEEVTQFIADNNEIFANRRIYIVDQIIVPSPPPALMKSLKDLEQFDAIKAEVAKYNLTPSTAVGTVDSLTVPLPIAKQIAGLSSDGVFIMPGDGMVRINHIRESQVSPVSGESAERLAKEMLVQTRRQRQVQDGVARILKEGRSKVKFNPAFQPATSPTGKSDKTGG